MKQSEEQTLAYYANHADAFCARTGSISFNPLQDRFLQYLPEHSAILDFGCGSGRDALAFQQAGHTVTALDGTPAFLERLEGSGLKIICSTFDAFDEVDAYDGIWACASLLHLEQDALKSVLSSIYNALHEGGIFYCSMKKGNAAGIRDGRYFLDQTIESLRPLLEEAGFTVLELFETEDARPEQKGRPWINAICQKR